MFGLLRVTLALLVVIYHFRWSKLLGPFAVVGFYVISGYLMTLVMHESYGYDGRGRRRFLANRALRLFPAYWFAAALTAVLVIAAGDGVLARQLHFAMYLPHGGVSIVENLLMFFPAWTPTDIAPRLVMDAWTLTVEVFFYLAICLGVSRTLPRCLIWLGVSLGYEALSLALGWPWADRYMPIPAASLPFCIGALIYHASRDPRLVERFGKRIAPGAWFVALLTNGFIWGAMTRHAEVKPWFEIGAVINLALAAGLVFGIASGGRLFRISPAVDKFLGDLSYPIYLLQWQAAAISTWLLTGSPRMLKDAAALRAWPLTAAIAILMAIVVVYAIDHPVQRLRARVRPQP